MIASRGTRIIIFAVFLIAFAGAFAFAFDSERQMCMGVPLIEEEQLARYTENPDIDVGGLMFCGEPVALDLRSGSIFISQAEDTAEHWSLLRGRLEPQWSSQHLYFVRDEAILDIARAVRESVPLTLVVIQGGSYRRLSVQITTLPVLCLSRTVETGTDEDGRTIWEGKAALFAGYDESMGRMTVSSYTTTLHVRGKTSAQKVKQPWKLSLREEDGKNCHADLLGMGADDDWILNPMNMDDTKLREKLMIDVWNRHVEASPGTGFRMSDARYVEVLLDGAYQGLYLLQRRIDEKYLELDPSRDLLFKGIKTWSAQSLQEGYEIIYTPFEAEETYRILSGVLEQARVHIGNYVDIALFLQYAHAPDNMGYYNMYYVLRAEETGYRMYLLPWDTDMSMGFYWQEGIGFVHDAEGTLKSFLLRLEYESMEEKIPQLSDALGQRWLELRGTMYSADAIEQCIRANVDILERSGAYRRETDRWGLCYGGSDTWDGLICWCMERLDRMDQHYAPAQ